MELIRLNPSSSILSGNPLPVEYYVSPWNDTIRNSNIFIIVSVAVELSAGSGNFVEIYNQKLIPGQDGSLSLDLSPIVSPHLEYLVPGLTSQTPLPAFRQLRNFRISATYLQNGQTITTDTSYRKVMKAGASMVQFNPEYFSLSSFETWFTQSKPLAFYNERKDRVHKEDVFFLFFLKPYGVNLLRFRYTITYLWGDVNKTTSGALTEDIETGNEEDVYAIPAGWQQSGLNTKLQSLHADAIPIKYAIEVLDDENNSVMEPISFILEQQQFYNTRQLLYRNSLGGLQPLRLYGQTEFLAEYQRAQVRRVTPPNYIINDAIKEVLSQNSNEEVAQFKTNTGWLSRYEAERMRDFLLSPQVFEVSPDHRLIPIRITGDKISFYGSEDGLISIGIEYSHAVVNKFFTHPLTSLSADCPAVKSFNWKQTALNEITVYWAFPFGYALGELTVTFPGEEAQSYFLDGNSGIQRLLLPRPASANTTVTLLTEARVICNNNVIPVVKGPAFEKSAPYLAAMPIVLNNDVITGLHQPYPYVLPNSVLENDYDPEGSELEVNVVNSNTVTVDGSSTHTITYSINAAGFITILYNSGGPFNKTITYEARRKSGGSWASAAAVIKVNMAEQFVYAKLFTRNITTQGSNTYGDVFIELFKDANATQPLVVTSLIVNWKKYYRVKVTGHSDNTTETTGSTLFAGVSSIKIYSGQLSYVNRGGSTNTWFEILTSGNYVKI